MHRKNLFALLSNLQLYNIIVKVYIDSERRLECRMNIAVCL